MSKIRIKKGLVVTKGDNTITVINNNIIQKIVSVDILNAITGETLPANLTHAEFTERYLTDSAAPSNKIEEAEPVKRLKMADGSIHKYEWFDSNVEITSIESGVAQTVTGDYFEHLVKDKHVTIL